MEFNKIFAAILCAAITVMLVNFVGDNVSVAEELKTDAVAIEGAPVAVADAPAAAAAPAKLADPILALLAGADLAKGKKLSKACVACHSFEKGGPVKQGPNLWNIVGAPKAGKADFSYSKNMKAAGGDWDYDSLNQFFTKPKKYIKKTKMNYAGLKKPAQRAALIAWLRTQADTPVALPSAEEIAAEAQ